MSNILSILITTYNRSIALDYLLEKLNDYQKRGLSFSIVVSDDMSTDNTLEICNKWKSLIQNLKVVTTESHTSMDNNFVMAYNACETKYCWLLGDSRYIFYEELQKIINILSKDKYDALILRCRDDITIESKVYTEINNLIDEQGWHITNNASFVIPTKYFNYNIYHRYMGTTFLHYGIAIENLCLLNSFKVAYISDIFVKDISVEGFIKKGWSGHSFYNFGEYWYTFIMSLPCQIKLEIKEKVLKDHNKHTDIFSVFTVIRTKAMYNDEYVQSYKKCRKYMPFVSNIPICIYDLCMLTPISLLKGLKKIYRLFH